jgi:hypothetical protein
MQSTSVFALSDSQLRVVRQAVVEHYESQGLEVNKYQVMFLYGDLENPGRMANVLISDSRFKTAGVDVLKIGFGPANGKLVARVIAQKNSRTVGFTNASLNLGLEDKNLNDFVLKHAQVRLLTGRPILQIELKTRLSCSKLFNAA